MARTESIHTIMNGTSVLIIKIRLGKKKAYIQTMTTYNRDNSRLGRQLRKSLSLFIDKNKVIGLLKERQN